MSTGQLTPVLRYLVRISGAAASATLTDGQLLDRFVHRGDETAFATLVRRHGPMVLAVCRRVLRDVHDAEDAFQATFLLLVKKARSLRQPELLGPWLHGVAHRTALKARSLASKRRARQRPMVDLPASVRPDADWRDMAPVLDAAIRELPGKYRTPFVLCHLEGMTNAQAANRLGCPPGTIATRLSRARERLRIRLTKQGVALTTATFGLALAENASADMVPLTLVQMMMELASVARTNAAAGAGAISGHVAALTEGVGRAMLIAKLRFVCLAALITVGTVGIGAGLLALRAEATQPGATSEKPATPSVASPANAQPASSAPAPSAGAPIEPAVSKAANADAKKRLPKGPPPVTAMAVLDGEGRLVLRFPGSGYYYQPKTTYQRLPDGRTAEVTSYEVAGREEVRLIELKELQAFGTDGHKVEAQSLTEMLKKEIPVLVSANGQPVDRFHLQLIKDGTLVLVLPQSGIAAPPMYESYFVPAGTAPAMAPPQLPVPPIAPAEPVAGQRAAPQGK